MTVICFILNLRLRMKNTGNKPLKSCPPPKSSVPIVSFFLLCLQAASFFSAVVGIHLKTAPTLIGLTNDECCCAVCQTPLFRHFSITLQVWRLAEEMNTSFRSLLSFRFKNKPFYEPLRYTFSIKLGPADNCFVN